MAINSREKGRRGEAELAALFREYGFEDARRGQQYCGANGDADVVGLPGIHAEVKRKEKLNIDDALAQAARDCGDNTPAVFHRKNRTEWKVTLYLDDFMNLYKEAKK